MLQNVHLGALYDLSVVQLPVSKWKRGLGFPDINIIEDLANALEVSIVELMKSERKEVIISKENISEERLSVEEAVVNDVVQVAILPGIIMMVYGIVCRIRGKKSLGAEAIGICMMLIPIILIGAAFFGFWVYLLFKKKRHLIL